ncbi:MAG: DUF3795 domain-containing protein [Firmicutes bacterium]|nr:DUF3795 domain-containing protein [Bacillota bacterium]
MNRMIAFCGLVCSECPVFKATQKDDNQHKTKIAKSWSRYYGFELEPKDINCDGCSTENDQLFKHCKVCNIRKCCQEQHIENCAHCSDFPCNELNKIFEAVPNAKIQLHQIKNNL